MPYNGSVVITALGYVVYSFCSMYEEYHKMYRNIFEIAIDVDEKHGDDENHRPLIREQNDDVPTIKAD